MKKIILLLSLTITLFSCQQNRKTADGVSAGNSDWHQQLQSELPLLGHRNWIIIVDKAFPAQTAAGMEVINTNEKLLPVLKYTLGQIDSSAHVNAIIYQDKELHYLTEKEVSGITTFRTTVTSLFGHRPVQSILHDSVFTRMDAASKLFKIMVLKTNETIPYSSVFLQLDCKYWSADREQQLRADMEQ